MAADSPFRNGLRRQVGGRLTTGANADPAELEAQIAAGTAGIKAHLDRINLYVAAGDADHTYGALVDLFIVTGTNAAEVRGRALHWSRSVIDAAHYSVLAANAARDVNGGAALPLSRYSLLSPSSPVMSVVPDPQPETPVTAPASSAVEEDRFEPGETVLAPVVAAVARARADSTTHRVTGEFGEIVVTPDSMSIRLDPEADLSEVNFRDVDTSSGPVTADDLEGAVTPDVGLWNLTLAVSGHRLPVGLDVTSAYHLDRMPALSQIDRIYPDARILSQLRLQAIQLEALLAAEGPEVRSILSAAWVCGLLSKDESVPAEPAPVTDHDPGLTAEDDAPADGSRLRAFLSNLPEVSNL